MSLSRYSNNSASDIEATKEQCEGEKKQKKYRV